MKYKSNYFWIEAYRYAYDPMPKWFSDKLDNRDIKLFNHNYLSVEERYCKILHNGKIIEVKSGDFLIYNNGDIIHIKKDLFNKLYCTEDDSVI